MQAFSRFVPQRKGKHAAIARNGSKPPLRVGRENDLSIGVAMEAMLELFELTPNLAKIIDFPVVHDPISPALRLHGLMSQGREIENRQPAVTQYRPAVRKSVNTAVIRATVF